jgi:hypothetical protein
VVLSGGLMEHSTILEQKLKERISRELKNVRIVYPLMSAGKAAAVLAKNTHLLPDSPYLIHPHKV